MDKEHVLDKCKLDFYVYRTRYIIVIQFNSTSGYIVWDYGGKEQHRITVSSTHFFSGGAITFDNELPIDNNSDLLWINCKVSEIDFCNLIGADFETIKTTFDKYSTNWLTVIGKFKDV